MELLELVPKDVDSVICGGQAVLILAGLFVDSVELDALGPLASKDMDLVIRAGHIQSLLTLRSSELQIRRFEDPRQPLYGAISRASEPEVRVELLRGVHGLNLERDHVFETAVAGVFPCKVLNPVTMFIAKAANSATIPQMVEGRKRRSDFRHLKIMCLVLKGYLGEMVKSCDPEQKTQQREIIRQLKQLEAAVGREGKYAKGLQLAGVRLWDAIPHEVFRDCPLETLKRYYAQTLIPQMEEL